MESLPLGEPHKMAATEVNKSAVAVGSLIIIISQNRILPAAEMNIPVLNTIKTAESRAT